MAKRESSMVGYGVVIRIGRFPDQILPSARPGLGAQTRYKPLGDVRVEIVENAVINIGLVRLSPRE